VENTHRAIKVDQCSTHDCYVENVVRIAEVVKTSDEVALRPVHRVNQPSETVDPTPEKKNVYVNLFEANFLEVAV